VADLPETRPPSESPESEHPAELIELAAPIRTPPLIEAVLARDPGAVAYLLANGEDPNELDARGNNALVAAIILRRGYGRAALLQIVDLLLPATNVKAVDPRGRTVLMAADLPLAAARARSLQADLRALQARIAARVDKEPKKEERDEEARLTREMREWLALADTIGARAPIRGIVTAIRGLGDEKLPLTRARLAEVEEQSAGAMEHRNRPTALGEPPRGRATRKIVD
jgi:ankyrin repeat protein